jgi:hypothetical protein
MSETDTAEPITAKPPEDADVVGTPTTDVEDVDEDQDDNAETFPRSYVEELRRENARYRERARSADTYAKRLHAELVRATGKLADPTDLEFTEEHLDDPAALSAAVDDLLARKPHLASRRPIGEIGQGASPSATTVDLAALLRQRAR